MPPQATARREAGPSLPQAPPKQQEREPQKVQNLQRQADFHEKREGPIRDARQDLQHDRRLQDGRQPEQELDREGHRRDDEHADSEISGIMPRPSSSSSAVVRRRRANRQPQP
jgi:hypothetical protein